MVVDTSAVVATASEQQSLGIQQISEAMEQISQVTQQNAASSEESASAAAELSAQAEEVRNLISLFQLSQRPGATGRSPVVSGSGTPLVSRRPDETRSTPPPIRLVGRSDGEPATGRKADPPWDEPGDASVLENF